METLIPKLYCNYGLYVNRHKMLPSSVDGLIPIWRRILLATHEVAKKDYVKTVLMIGHCIGHYHPHTEAIQGSIQMLVLNGFLDGGGSWGSKYGIEPLGCAAPRYTSVRSNEVIEELALKYVDYVDWVEEELQPEPKILPTMIPICLFTKHEFNMIAFGFKTEIPSYNLTDLIKRLLYLLDKGDKIIIRPTVPNCTVTSNDSTVEKLLTTADKNTIDIVGKYTTDPNNFRVFIHGWSPRIGFDTLFNKIDNYKKWGLFASGDVSWIDESNKKVGTKIRLEVAKARNRPAIYDKLLEAVKDRLTAKLNYSIYAVNPNGDVVLTTVDEMLLNAYNYYKDTLVVYYKKQIENMKINIDETKIIVAIRPHMKVSLAQETPKEMIEKLAELTKYDVVSIDQVISKYRIKKLMTVKVELNEMINKLNEYKSALDNIDEIAIQDYRSLLMTLTTSKK